VIFTGWRFKLFDKNFELNSNVANDAHLQ